MIMGTGTGTSRPPRWRVGRSRRSVKGLVGRRQRGGFICPRALPVELDLGLDGVDVPFLRDTASEAARIGSQVIWEALDKPVEGLETKRNASDLVTRTDKMTEDAILAYLRRELGGDHMILGEEGGYTGNPDSDFLWCIDPLDGTTNFAHGFPSFATSVGLLYKGVAVAGSVVEFTGGPSCWGTRAYAVGRGLGATCNGEPISVSDRDSVQDALLVTGFGYDHGEAWAMNMDFFKHFTDVSRGVRRLGAAAADLCQVALGVTEAYHEFYLKPWDVCAGVLIVEESGGKVTTLDGRPYTVFDKSLLASNGLVHEEMMHHIAPRVETLSVSEELKERWFIPDGYEAIEATPSSSSSS
ncbi:inositol monophosphatase [Chloropicon primus]|nr:inositol monophosphatase [Chloropicon primus]